LNLLNIAKYNTPGIAAKIRHALFLTKVYHTAAQAAIHILSVVLFAFYSQHLVGVFLFWYNGQQMARTGGCGRS
jgi:hypothetical protein